MAAVVEEVMYNGKLFCCYVKGDFGAEPVCQVAWVQTSGAVNVNLIEEFLTLDPIILTRDCCGLVGVNVLLAQSWQRLHGRLSICKRVRINGAAPVYGIARLLVVGWGHGGHELTVGQLSVLGADEDHESF